MKPILLLIITIAFAHFGHAQVETNQQYQINRPTLQDIPTIEKKMRGKKIDYRFNVTVSPNYFPGAAGLQLANPMVFHRPGSNGITEVSYFYTHHDKVVRLIEYSFDKPASDTSLLKHFFAANENYFLDLFKKPAITTNEVHDNWWQKIQVWDNNLVFVKQFIVIGEGTYRVRVLVSWKK